MKILIRELETLYSILKEWNSASDISKLLGFNYPRMLSILKVLRAGSLLEEKSQENDARIRLFKLSHKNLSFADFFLAFMRGYYG